MIQISQTKTARGTALCSSSHRRRTSPWLFLLAGHHADGAAFAGGGAAAAASAECQVYFETVTIAFARLAWTGVNTVIAHHA